jgi:two-component system, OmpR family, KDP operon response regulator KdpE
MATRILIVDDAPELTLLLKLALSREGYQVETANDGLEGLRKAYDLRPDLILLDIMMPGMSGLEMLSRFREFSEVPVIMLTALGKTDAKIDGLNKGADDYVTKPFDTDELKARIRALLRRAALSAPKENQILSFDGGQLAIDLYARHVTVGGEPASLTPTEYKLLLYLAHNAGTVLTFDQILNEVWGPGYEDNPDVVKVYIRRLRTKIEPDPSNPRYILSHRSTGYCLAKI